jgi:oligopeptidase A
VNTVNPNPLLDFSGLPRFDEIRPEHVGEAVDRLLEENRAIIATLTQPETSATWESCVAPLADANERLGRAWGCVSHLHGVLDSPALREAYNASQPKIVQYYTELGQNLALFEKYRTLRAAPEYATLTPTQQRILELELRDFRLSGAELPPDRKLRFAEVQSELAKLSTRFSENLLDATNALALYLRQPATLAGVPDDVLEGFREGAAKDGRDGYKITLKTPAYMPIMQYCENRELRQTLYRASSTRASEEYAAALQSARAYAARENGDAATGEAAADPSVWDNSAIIDRILELRSETAQLLGYANFAELSLVPKMAQSPRQVLDFLGDLARRAKPFAARDFAELAAFARDQLGLENPQVWDYTFASEKLRSERYAFSEQEVKQYFPEPKVLEGMFRVVQTLYGVRIEEDRAPTWHPDVRFFRVRDGRDGTIGQFYLDAYARDTKRGGAWMDEALSHRRLRGSIQHPVAYMVCNFAPPVGDRPALLMHDDVITLFHEFGHALHHLLSQVDEIQASGIHGVEWDAVELPSQFMENFCWEWDVLEHMTAHVDSGAPLPHQLFDRMLAAKNFQSGMQTVRQLEFSLFDLHLHYDFTPDAARTPDASRTPDAPATADAARSADGANARPAAAVMRLLDTIRREVAVVIPPQYNRFPHSFGHIFAGGYSAGYYSYKWAEVLSADAYSLFEEHGVLDAATGARFRDEILAVGGSRPAIDSFRAFRGRDPQVDALLRHNGMVEEMAAGGR